MGSAMVIYGSDDDLEDDISNEYEEYREKSMSANSASIPGSSHAEQPEYNSGDTINTAMHEAHTGLFHQDASINITDQTGYIDLESATTSTSLKRNRTTMEQLSSKNTTYDSKSRLIDVDEQERNAADRPVLGMPASKKQKQVESTGVHLPVPDSKRSDSTNFDMSSSRETHAAGSKDLPNDSPELFRTQTTVPFSGGTQAYLPTQVITPMVLIPPMPNYEAKSSADEVAPGSSALLNEQIDGIHTWLQDDIEQERAAQRAVQAIELPDTDPALPYLPETNASTVDNAKTAIDSQALVLDPSVKSDFSEKPGDLNQNAAARVDHTVTKERSKSRKRDRTGFEAVGYHEDDNDAETHGFDPEGDELAEGLPPPEMYKPRPSRSRGRRGAADPNGVQNDSAPRTETSNKTSKKRTTAGDAGDMVASLLTNQRASKVDDVKDPKFDEDHKSSSSRPQNHKKADNSDEATTSACQNTIEVGYQMEDSDTKPKRVIPAPKKKRGRPRKADKLVQNEHADMEESFQKISEDAEVLAKALNGLESKPDKKAHSDEGRQCGVQANRDSAVLEDSEDELAGDVRHGKRRPEVSAAAELSNIGNTAPGHEGRENDESENEDEEPVTAPKKRGRRLKSAKALAKSIPNDAAKEARPETVDDDPLEKTAAPGIEPPRSPLKEKTDAQNQNLPASKTSAPPRSTSPEKQTEAPETPRPQAGGIAARPSPLTTGKNAVRYRVGLSRKTRIEPLLKTLKR